MDWADERNMRPSAARRPTLLLLLLIIQSTHTFKSLAVVSKIIIDQVKGATRPGGGGVQAAAGARLGGDQGLSIALHAPVGMDFDDALLGGLEPYSIECSNVAKLESVKTTPGEKISYDGDEMKFEPVGWDQWDDLCDWEPTELASGSYDAVHVIVEGSGAGEVKSALRACAVARVVGDDQPCIGIEPVFQKLSKASMEGGPLLELTRVATLISPDLATAICMRDAFLEEKDNDDTKRPCDVSSISKAAARNRNAYLLEMCAALFDELCMQPGSLLAIRDGAYGSYLYSRPAPNAPMWQWLTLTRDYEWLARVPAVELTEEEVRDPTGAGNAYAGALCAQLANGADPIGAASIATAVGAAFCKSSEAFPTDAEAARVWVEKASEAVKERIRVVVEATDPDPDRR